MSDTGSPTWRFPKYFWSANVAELFERAAYYGVFIGLAVYLTRNFGFSDVGAGWVGAYYGGTIYLLPLFAGAWADSIGFRKSLALAFLLLGGGYGLLGLSGTEAAQEVIGQLGAQIGAIVSLTIIMIGGAFVKAVISGTVAKASNEATRARAFSIFYQVVNIGSFLGKTFAYPLRMELGLQYVSFYSAVMGIFGMVVVLLYYKGVDSSGEGRSMREVARALARVMRNVRFVTLILIVAGFWLIQGQLYAAMPKYMLRTVGDFARPEWLANINPLVVVIFVIPVTQLVRKLRPVTSIGIALLIIPVSSFVVSLSPMIARSLGSDIEIFGIGFHPVTLMLIAGIALQGLSECFLSPRYLEYASKQAPKGEEGLYMGFSHLHSFFGWWGGFVLSGYLLEAFCPDPETLAPEVQAQWAEAIRTGGPMPEAYAHAHYIWYVFAAVGVASFLLLMVFRYVTDRADRKRAAATDGAEA